MYGWYQMTPFIEKAHESEKATWEDQMYGDTARARRAAVAFVPPGARFSSTYEKDTNLSTRLA